MNDILDLRGLMQHAARVPSRVVAPQSSFSTSIHPDAAFASTSYLDPNTQALRHISHMTRRILDGAMIPNNDTAYMTPIIEDVTRGAHSTVAITILTTLFYFAAGIMLLALRCNRQCYDDHLIYLPWQKPESSTTTRSSPRHQPECEEPIDSRIMPSSRQTHRKISSIQSSLLPTLFRVRGMSARDTLRLNLNGVLPPAEEDYTSLSSTTAGNDLEPRQQLGIDESPFVLTKSIRCLRAVFYLCEVVYQLVILLAATTRSKLYIAAALMGLFVGHMILDKEFENEANRERLFYKGAVAGLAASREVGDDGRMRKNMDAGVRASSVVGASDDEEVGMGLPTPARSSPLRVWVT